MTMKNEKSYIGIDVSKAMLDVYILPAGRYMRVENNTQGIKNLTKEISAYIEPFVVTEATGGYEKEITKTLAKKGVSVAVVNPRQIRDFAKALGKLAKTDYLDAKVIATYAEKMQPASNVINDENQEKLAEYNARRRQLVDMITMEKNRLDKVSKETRKSLERIIKLLEKELERIEKMLAEVVQQDEHHAEQAALLQTIKGIGVVVSTTIIADLPEIGKLSHREISALAGLAPLNCDSGNMKGKRIIWGGRASVRCSLYMATLSAIRCNKQIKIFYQRLCGTGKPKKVAITACMHKLLTIMNAISKNQEPWRIPA